MAKPSGKILSVCIPTYNRPECMKNSLTHYAQIIQGGNLEGKVEICISDNSPNDETEKVVRQFSGRLDIRYSRNGNNLGYDRNAVLAVSLASGRFAQLVGDELMYGKQAMEKAVGLLENDEFDSLMFDDDGLFPECHGMPYLAKDGSMFWRKALSYEWVKRRSITHIDFIIIRSSDFREYLKFLGGRIDGFYGLTFIQLSFYFFSFKRSRRVCIVDTVNEPVGPNVPESLGVYFPSDDARVIYYKYFFEIRECRKNGILSEEEYTRFKRNFLLSAITHLLRIRTHMYPPIYKKEEADTLKHIILVENEYAGFGQTALWLLRKILFIEPLPYHLLYRAFVFYRNRILRKPRPSALELYERCLDGEKIDKSRLYKTDF
jgi:glycosyltransferase involved in cell wall biosynthesis